MKKAIVSRCLLGDFCRYDGKTKKDHNVCKFLEQYEIIPFCPEAPIFGTPRERINVVNIDGVEQIITDQTDQNVTMKLKKWIETFIKEHPKADVIILKSKSPSCGNQTTPILDNKKNILYYGDGIGTKMLKKHFKEIPFYDETNLPIL